MSLIHTRVHIPVCIISVAMQMMCRRCCCYILARQQQIAQCVIAPKIVYDCNYFWQTLPLLLRITHVYVCSDTHRSAIDHCRAPTESVFCAASGTRRAKQRVESASRAEERDVQYSTALSHIHIHTRITARRLLGLPSYSSSVVSRRFMPSMLYNG
uniref:Secreted protein n=1 Tax=Trichogramma kaykai TaxID=54128 RepID=A0ABD2WXU3_9HYME